MRYVSILREVDTRLRFHAEKQGILDGLKHKRVGEWEVSGEKDLPDVTIADLELVEDPTGKSMAKINIFLRVPRKHGGLFSPDDDADNGAIDWVERIFDAIETKPSDGLSDQGYLIAHYPDGTLYKNLGGAPVQLLGNQMRKSSKLTGVGPLAFTIQIDLYFDPVLTRNANRRQTPIPVLGDQR